MSVFSSKDVTLNIVLDVEKAWQFAQFLKRMGLSDYREKASTEDEAYSMLVAGEMIRAALARESFTPR